ncbi:MAG: SDR family oxidoreductase [Armatimonadetes bacterium]|nr:SDR family oxidoreductase [Armatimonadota bacterium]
MSLVCLVTGSSRGIGRTTVELLAAKGHTVYASMRDPQGKNKEHADALAATCKVIELDVCDEASVVRAVKTIHEQEGRLDAVVNNAGYGLFGPMEETTEEAIKRVFETNFYGVLRVCRAALPIMRQQNSGVIVQVSSISGEIVTPFGGPYQASKWALEAATHAMQMEARHFGIRCVSVQPGNVETEIVVEWPETMKNETSLYMGLRDQMRATPMAYKFSTPTMVAEAIIGAIEDPKTPMRVPIGDGVAEMIDLYHKLNADEWIADTWQRRNLTW